MTEPLFDRMEHVYRNDDFAELVKDAVRFFNGTPVHSLPPPRRFEGAGVYAIYCTSQEGLYARYGKLNRLTYSHPIYVGKAVPKGWRQARVSDTDDVRATELFGRLRQHANNISSVSMVLAEFKCRFVIFEEAGSDMIGTVEAALIKIHRPLWNTALDGFGNHDPGKGRYDQARSDWDVIHPGRAWAAKCKGEHHDDATIRSRIRDHLRALK